MGTGTAPSTREVSGGPSGRRLRVLVDFLAVSRGGGQQNVLNLWRAISETETEVQWLAVLRDGQPATSLPLSSWQEIEVWPVGGLRERLLLENRRLPGLAERWGADLIFTPMGAGPVVGRTPTLIGWHDATVAYPESPMWRRSSWRFRTSELLRQSYAARAARRAEGICVQTETMATRLSRRWGIPRERFQLVPNGPSAFLAAEAAAPGVSQGGTQKILVIGEPKPSKNLEIVPAVAHHLRATGLQGWEMLLTLEAEPDSWGKPFARAAATFAHEDLPLRRVGRIAHTALGDVYRSASAVFLPSLLESFSATYVEAMHFGVPLVTSDLDFARDICGDAALYADPLDPAACASQLARVLGDEGLRTRLRAAGFERLRHFPDWGERLQLYLGACRSAVRSGSA